MQYVLSDLNKVVFLSNSIMQIILFGIFILIGLIFRRLFSKIFSRLLFRIFRSYSKEVSIDNFVDLLRKPIGLFILLVFIGLGFDRLTVPVEFHLVNSEKFGLLMIIEKFYVIMIIISIISVLLKLVDFFGLILLKKAEKNESKTDDQLIPFMVDSIKVVLVILGIFLILGSVFKLNIGSLIAGLGIGGLAIALAAKDTLENLLGSFTIFLDKPFTQGDLVKVGNITGVVEKVGFRSTRIRTLEKSFVTVPNKKMIDSELDNLSLRTSQRAKFTVNLSYSTSIDQIETIIRQIKNYLDNHQNINDDAVVSFSEFGTSYFEIMVIF
ncbi:MAG: mechanosensitive ion channel family protein, partial [Bacteroidota bacterium]|nr:mechanosensitive ion channel family protein [Bacteroidota bacterium]